MMTGPRRWSADEGDSHIGSWRSRGNRCDLRYDGKQITRNAAGLARGQFSLPSCLRALGRVRMGTSHSYRSRSLYEAHQTMLGIGRLYHGPALRRGTRGIYWGDERPWPSYQRLSVLTVLRVVHQGGTEGPSCGAEEYV
jgi:hypothetical protein